MIYLVCTPSIATVMCLNVSNIKVLLKHCTPLISQSGQSVSPTVFCFAASSIFSLKVCFLVVKRQRIAEKRLFVYVVSRVVTCSTGHSLSVNR